MIRPRTDSGVRLTSGFGRRTRAGFTLLEVQVAFALLGIGLIGVVPLVVLQLKLSAKVQNGINPQTSYFGATQTYYMTPASDAWARKLGVGATISSTASSPSGTTGPELPSYVVSIVSPIQKSSVSDSVTVTVSVTADGS